MSFLEHTHKAKPSNLYCTTDPKKATKIRVEADGFASRPPISIPDFVNQTVKRFPNNIGLVYKDANKTSQKVTFKEYEKNIVKTAKAFIKLGLEPRCSVGIMSFNCPEWFYSALGTIYANGIEAGIYTTNSAEVVHHILQFSNANIIVVDDSRQMKKVVEIKDRLPLLKAAIQLNGDLDPSLKEQKGFYYTWSQVQSLDTSDVEEEYKKRLSEVAINECCCLIFTSGTVGFPKGVMLHHDNITFMIATMLSRLKGVEMGNEALVSYLPLSHVAGQVFDLFCGIGCGATVYFADRDALKGSLIKTLVEARPTKFLGVPRVYEKIASACKAMESKLPSILKTVIEWARGVSLQHHKGVLEGNTSESWTFKFVRNFVLYRFKQYMGLDRCNWTVTGAAPLANDVKEFFLSIDLRLSEVYGMSESSGVQSLSSDQSPNLETVGQVVPGIEAKIHNPDADGNGEICVRGRSVFMGYIGEPEKTKAVIDDDGWLHTEDIGKLDDEGYLYITGRIKELIITAGGENIPPVHIEDLIKKQLNGISNVMLIGDRRKYLTVLLTIKTRMDLNTGAPLDDLTRDSLEWMKSLGLSYTKLSEILEAGPCPKVLKAIQDGIDRANAEAISNAQRVQKFSLLPHDFSVATGELGPTLKLKRSVAAKKYEQIIEKMYE